MSDALDKEDPDEDLDCEFFDENCSLNEPIESLLFSSPKAFTGRGPPICVNFIILLGWLKSSFPGLFLGLVSNCYLSFNSLLIPSP